MACNKNINGLLNIDFATTNDEFNWVSNISNPIQTVGGQLVLKPESATSEFRRGLGSLDPTNNRINLQINMELFRPVTSQHDKMTVVFGVYTGTTLIGEYSVYLDSIANGEKIEYNFDRVYNYEAIAGNINLKVTIPEGYENEVLLDYMICQDQNFCEDNIRTYFAVDKLIEDSLASVSSGFQLLEWKVDDVETLTPDFFADNASVGGDPSNDWNFAKANIDGSNREAEPINPNTFNPFINELGLTFENVAGNYYGGKPTGVASGKDYGSGILEIGFGKPKILNGNLDSRNGAFFIDIDYTKNLKIVFNVIVNNTNSNVFDSPDIYRKYTITWDSENCIKSFYYEDQLSATPTVKIPVDEDGFLFGLTGIISTQSTITCDESFSYDGNSGVFETVIDFGSDIGEAGINYNAFNVPDKFEIEWNGNIISSGYVGLDTYNQQLINLGINPSEIKTDNPSSGSGQLLFTKDQASPNTAIIRVSAPLSGTAWNISGICPDGIIKTPPTVEITTVKTSYELSEEVAFDITASDTDGTIDTWEIDFGDGTTQSGSGNPPLEILKEYDSLGSKVVVITVTDNDGLIGTDSVTLDVFSNAQYTLTGDVFADCNDGMSGTLEVLSGTIIVKNKWTPIQGTPTSTFINIDGGSLYANQTIVLGVGSYPFTADPIVCTNGTATNELIVL